MRGASLSFVPVAFGVLVGCSGTTQAPDPEPAPATPPSSIVPTAPPAPQPVAPESASAPTPVTPPPPTSTPPACTLNTGSVACDQCSMQSCCAAISACDGDPDCIAVDGCIAQCFETYGRNQAVEAQCEQRCRAAHPSGAQKIDTLYQCMSTSCGAACPE